MAIRKARKRKARTPRKDQIKASRKVARAMREMKKGKLRSGRSGKKVSNPKQAVAIGLSEARRRDKAKIPPPPRRKSRPHRRKKAARE